MMRLDLLRCIEPFAPRLNGPTWLCCSAWCFSCVLLCDCLCFLWSLLILVSDSLLPQRSDHLSSVFALIAILAKLKVTNEIGYPRGMYKVKHTHLRREIVLEPSL